MKFREVGRPIILLAVGMAAIGCQKDGPTTVIPVDYGSITTINYSQHVQPLLSRSCATSGCHDAPTNAAGLSLASWSQLTKGSTYGEVVLPFKPTKSLLVMLFDGTSLRRQHPVFSPMFSADEITFLKRWIAEGARNDAGQMVNTSNRVYVPNQAEDNVAIIDADNLVVFRYINVGVSPTIDGPHFIVANQDYWYVSLIGTAQVWKFDARMDTLMKTCTIQGQPALLALTPDGSKLYVSQFMTSSNKKVAVVNTATMTVAKTIDVLTMPHGIRINTAGTRLYVANMLSDYISVIDVASDSVVASLPLAYDANIFGPAKYMPMEIAVSPNDSLFLVTCSETREVRVFDAATNSLVDSFAVGDQPWHLQFTPDGDMCYVANRRGNSVSAIHLPMHHVMATVTSAAVFNYPHGCDVSADGRYVFVSSENVGHGYLPRYSLDYNGNVSVIDVALNQVVKVLEVGAMPTGLSITR